jgi:AAA ATPase domain
LDASTDPYEPGAGTLPPLLAGRDAEQAVYEARRARLLAGRRAQGLALWGLRGVGKTVLLRDFKRRAEQDRWLTGLHELGTGEQLRPVIAQVAIDALEALHGRRQLRAAAQRVRRVLRSFTVTAMPHGVSFSLQVEPEPGRGDSGRLQQDTHDVLAELGAVARQADVGVTLLFDELQLADSAELGALLRALQQLEERELPILVVGAGLPDLPLKLVEASSYAERMFTYHEIGELDEGAAREALALPAAQAGVAYTPEALDYIISQAGGFPFFLQTYGSHAWLSAPSSPIDLKAARRADAAARRALDTGFHRIRWERATPAEQTFLRALAELGDGAQPIAKINKILGKTGGQTTMVRDRLINVRGLIHSPGRGLVQFNTPLFAEYVRARAQGGTSSDAIPHAIRSQSSRTRRRL